MTQNEGKSGFHVSTLTIRSDSVSRTTVELAEITENNGKDFTAMFTAGSILDRRMVTGNTLCSSPLFHTHVRDVRTRGA